MNEIIKEIDKLYTEGIKVTVDYVSIALIMAAVIVAAAAIFALKKIM